jgi:hypothetical protein
MTPGDRTRLLGFLGYGTPSKSQFMFIGEKEYTPGGTELMNCEIRATSFGTPWDDKNRATQLLAAGFAARGGRTHAQDFQNALTPGPQFQWSGGVPGGCSVGVWTWAALIIAAWRAPGACTPNGAWFRLWQAEYRKLGTFQSDSTLVELYPLPMKGVTTWPPEYVSEFSYPTADAYFQGVFPIGRISARQQLLVQQALVPLPTNAVVVGYGRGGKGAEFWRRYDQLFAPKLTKYEGNASCWHVIVPNQVEIAISARGQLVARVGFPWTRPTANPVTQEHIPALVEALRRLRLQNP